MKNRLNSLTCFAFLLVILPAVVSTKSCNDKKGGGQYTYPDANIEMSKTACFGVCPVYTFSIDGKGMATYTGKNNVEKTGHYKKTFSAAETNGLITAFEKANFWDFEDEYTAKVTDLPTTYLSFTLGTKSKKVKDYYGAPATLKALEKAVEEFANSDGWEKVED